MTLAQWNEASPVIARQHPSGAFWVPDGHISAWRRDLWHLSDYYVSSVIAGTIWLCPR